MKKPNQRRAQLFRIQQMHQKLMLPYSEPPMGENLDALESSLKYLLIIETEPTSTLSRQLIEDGIELPPPDSLDDDQIVMKLRDVILGLTWRHVILHNTNHLDDRAFYQHLWQHTLNEPSHDLNGLDENSIEHIDLAGCGGEESDRIHLQYYASDTERDMWCDDFPGESLPEKRVPPSGRDRRLPRLVEDTRTAEEKPEGAEPWETAVYEHMIAAGDYYCLCNLKLAHAELDQAERIPELCPELCPELRIQVSTMQMELYLMERNGEMACGYAQFLCENEPNFADHFINYAMALFQAGKKEEALLVLEDGPPTLAQDPLYHFNRGIIAYATGKIDLALDSIKTAISMDKKIWKRMQSDPTLKPMINLLAEEQASV